MQVGYRFRLHVKLILAYKGAEFSFPLLSCAEARGGSVASKPKMCRSDEGTVVD